MEQLILVLHVLVAVCIIGLVLIQHGKGADVGASFGSGSSNTMFGSQGATPVLVKITAILATVFFATSIVLGRIAAEATKSANGGTVISAPAIPASTTAPKTDNKANSVVPVTTKQQKTTTTMPVVPTEPKQQ